MDLSEHRGSDGRRLQSSEDVAGRRTAPYDVPRVGRTPVPHLALPRNYSYGVGSGRSARCIEEQQRSFGQGQSGFESGGGGPVVSGRRSMGIGTRDAFGKPTSLPCLRQQAKPRPGRTAFNQTCRGEILGGHAMEAQGQGPLLGESKEADAEQQTEAEQLREGKRGDFEEGWQRRREEGWKRKGRQRGRPSRVEDGRRDASHGTVRVPGAGASSVHAGIWDEAFTTLSRSRTALSAFFHSILACRAFGKKVPLRQLWPMPLLYPEMHRKGGRRDRHSGERKLALNYIVVMLDWLAVDETLVDVSTFALGQKLSGRQWAVVKSLTPLVDAWNLQGVVSPTDMGRAATKMENIEEVIRELEEAALRPSAQLRSYLGRVSSGVQKPWGAPAHPGVVVGSMSREVEHVAKDLEAHRLKFIDRPSFDPVPYLDDANRQQYLHPLENVNEVEPDDPGLPRVKVRCKGKAQMDFLEKLDSGGRLALLPLRDVEAGFPNGAFAIPKDQEKDRLVLDARRPNAREVSEARWIYTMGAAGQLQHLYLLPHQILVLHAEDLKDFYHAFVRLMEKGAGGTTSAFDSDLTKLST